MVRKGFLKKMMAAGLSAMLLLSMTACGGAASNEAYDSYYSGNSMKAESMDMELSTGTAWDGMYDYSYNDSYVNLDKVVETPTVESGELVTTSTRKTIKTAKLTMQTLDFDAFATALEQKVVETGAYFQYADVSGSNYYGGRRYASYTIRVPEARLNEFMAGLDGIATITNKTLGEQDVTLSYVDTESRIKALEIEMESLMELLEKAVNLESIIKLQDRLTEVRYELENYKAQLRTYDDKIAYSTVTLSVSEVKKVTEPTPVTVWERISSGFKNTMDDIIEGAEDLLVWVVINIPYLVFWAVVIVLLVVFIKKKNRKRKQRKLEKQREKDAAAKVGSEE